jgi:hypothetical protein
MFFTPIARAKKGRHKKVPPPQPTHIGAVKNPSHLAMHRCYEIKIGWNKHCSFERFYMDGLIFYVSEKLVTIMAFAIVIKSILKLK